MRETDALLKFFFFMYFAWKIAMQKSIEFSRILFGLKLGVVKGPGERGS